MGKNFIFSILGKYECDINRWYRVPMGTHGTPGVTFLPHSKVKVKVLQKYHCQAKFYGKAQGVTFLSLSSIFFTAKLVV
jgi:hypothetical protein